MRAYSMRLSYSWGGQLAHPWPGPSPALFDVFLLRRGARSSKVLHCLLVPGPVGSFSARSRLPQLLRWWGPFEVNK